MFFNLKKLQLPLVITNISYKTWLAWVFILVLLESVSVCPFAEFRTKIFCADTLCSEQLLFLTGVVKVESKVYEAAKALSD